MEFFDIFEQSCCRKQQKIHNQETGLENRGRLKVLNDTKLILKDYLRGLLQDFGNIQNLISKPVSWLELFCCFLQQDGSRYFNPKRSLFLIKIGISLQFLNLMMDHQRRTQKETYFCVEVSNKILKVLTFNPRCILFGDLTSIYCFKAQKQTSLFFIIYSSHSVTSLLVNTFAQPTKHTFLSNLKN